MNIGSYLLRQELADQFVHYLLNRKITKSVADFPKTTLLKTMTEKVHPGVIYLDEQFPIDFPDGKGKASDVCARMNSYIVNCKSKQTVQFGSEAFKKIIAAYGMAYYKSGGVMTIKK